MIHELLRRDGKARQPRKKNTSQPSHGMHQQLQSYPWRRHRHFTLPASLRKSLSPSRPRRINPTPEGCKRQETAMQISPPNNVPHQVSNILTIFMASDLGDSVYLDGLRGILRVPLLSSSQAGPLKLALAADQYYLGNFYRNVRPGWSSDPVGVYTSPMGFRDGKIISRWR